SEACIDWLEFLTDIKGGAYTNTDMGVIEGGQGYQTFIAMSTEAYKRIERQDVKFTEIRFGSVNSILALMWAYQGDRINYCGYPSKQGTTVLMSADAAFSMSSVTAAEDGVNAFLQFLLSDEIQTCQTVSSLGIPVTRSALTEIFPVGYVHYRYNSYNRKGLEKYKDAIFINQVLIYDMILDMDSQIKNFIFDVVRVTTDDRDLFLRFLDRAVVHTAADTTLQSILDEEISYVTADARNAADAAKILQSRVGIYLAE
ncbi:MAG: hypothetical protein IJ302_04005, partial [Clostridia bacterium]|nr:hypothetical protein [Clostridia bacterium]